MMLTHENGIYDVEQINACALRDPAAFVAEAERNYRGQIADLVRKTENRRILLVAGPSSSGKTTTAYRLADALRLSGRDVEIVSMDDFYKNRVTMPKVNGVYNFEIVESYEVDLVRQTVETLLREGTVQLPTYDFSTGIRRDRVKRVDLEPGGVVIIEGIHALSESVRQSFPAGDVLNVYLSPHSGFGFADGEVLFTRRQMRQVRRIVRDVRFRSSPAEMTLSLWKGVCEAEDLYIRPSVRYADFILDTTHAYEPCMLRDPAIQALSEVSSASVYRSEAEEISQKLRAFSPLPVSLLPQDSLMHEFFG